MGPFTTLQKRAQRLIALTAALLSLFLLSAGLLLRHIDRHVERVDEPWLKALNLLADIDNRLLRLRVNEGYRALAVTTDEREAAEALAEERRIELAALLDAYASLPKTLQDERQLRAARDHVERYMRTYEEWRQADPQAENTMAARLAGPLHIHFREADDSIIALIAATRAQAAREISATDWHIDLAQLALAVLAALVVLALLDGFRRLRSGIFVPVTDITRGLTDIMQGRPTDETRHTHRRDEIGDLARACQSFAESRRALEAARRQSLLEAAERERLTRHDLLTGLPNRTLFRERLAEALAVLHGTSRILYVFAIDIGNLPRVVELSGQDCADALIRTLAQRLAQLLAGARPSPLPEGALAHAGGGEFALFCEGERETAGGAISLAERLLEALRAPVPLPLITIEPQIRIGIALGPVDGEDCAELARAAEFARNRIDPATGGLGFYDPDIERHMRERARFDAAIRAAVSVEAFVPWFQPVVETATGRITGVEMLARWEREPGRVIAPAQFIPTIERLGLTTPMMLSLLRAACREARFWPEDLELGVNITPDQLREPDLGPRLTRVLREEGFDPHRLLIEVTEEALIGDITTAAAVLSGFRRLGARLALDDFGTGYSGFHQLRQISFDRLKIDQSYVLALDDPQDSRIVDAMIQLAHALGMEVVAEGVENVDLAEELARRGCRFAQGFHFARPMPAPALRQALAAGHARFPALGGA